MARLGALRKKLLLVLLDHLYLIEIAGGSRAICFMQVIVLLTSGHTFCFGGLRIEDLIFEQL